MDKTKKEEQNYINVLESISIQSKVIFLGKVGFYFLGFFSVVLLARILGATLLGRYQLGLVTVEIISIFCKIGFDQGLIRFIPILTLDNKGKIKKVIKENMAISFGLCTCFSILLYFYSPLIASKLFHSPDMTNVLKVSCFYLPVFTFFRLGLASLIGFKRADVASNIENIITPILFITFLAFATLIRVDLYYVIVARIVSQLVAIVCIGYFMLRKFSVVFESKSISYDFRKYFSFSVPLFLIGFIYYLIGQVDILMLGYFAADSHVGIYSAVVRLAMLIILGLQVVNATFAPNISELYARGDLESIEKLLKVLTKWIFYISLFVFVAFIVFRAEVLQFFGPSFTSGSRALVILCIGQFVNASTGPTGVILVMTGKQRWESLNTLGILGSNVVLNLILIPRFGIEGAAIATTTSIGIINIAKLLETYKEFKFHPYNNKYFKGIFAIFVGTLLSLFVHSLLNLLKLNFVVVFIFGLSVLFFASILVLYLLKFDAEDVVVFRKIGTIFS